MAILSSLTLTTQNSQASALLNISADQIKLTADNLYIACTRTAEPQLAEKLRQQQFSGPQTSISALAFMTLSSLDDSSLLNMLSALGSNQLLEILNSSFTINGRRYNIAFLLANRRPTLFKELLKQRLAHNLKKLFNLHEAPYPFMESFFSLEAYKDHLDWFIEQIDESTLQGMMAISLRYCFSRSCYLLLHQLKTQSLTKLIKYSNFYGMSCEPEDYQRLYEFFIQAFLWEKINHILLISKLQKLHPKFLQYFLNEIAKQNHQPSTHFFYRHFLLKNLFRKDDTLDITQIKFNYLLSIYQQCLMRPNSAQELCATNEVDDLMSIMAANNTLSVVFHSPKYQQQLNWLIDHTKLSTLNQALIYRCPAERGQTPLAYLFEKKSVE